MKRKNTAAEEGGESAEEAVAMKPLKKKVKKAAITEAEAEAVTPSPKGKKLKKKGAKAKAENDVPQETPAEEEPVETAATEDVAPAAEPAPVDIKASGQNDSEFQDETLSCRDCGADFVFSASQQEFFKSKGFDNKPGRCKECQQAKKMGGGGGGGFGRGGGRGGGDYGGRGGRGGRGGGGPRNCFNCGQEGHVSRECPKPAQPNVCFAFKQGNCTRGDSCKFQHV